MDYQLLEGDCLDQLKTLDEGSIDAVVTDPPYGLEFMGKEWDSFKAKKQRKSDAKFPGQTKTWTSEEGSGIGLAAPRFGTQSKSDLYAFQIWTEEWAREALRVLKPGGHLLAFGGSRTYHRLASAVEDAGFEIRDQIMWLYGSGFPKSMNVGKAIDKAAGAERKVIGKAKWSQPAKSGHHAGLTDPGVKGEGERHTPDITAPATEQSAQWEGWGTALKPAHEPIVVARKPLIGTVAANVLEHGTGAINVDGCRIGHNEECKPLKAQKGGNKVYAQSGRYEDTTELKPEGRWPANIILDEEAGEQLGEPSKFFYQAKASKKERNAGLDGFEEKKATYEDYRPNTHDTKGGETPFAGSGRTDVVRKNNHPTVKPIELMRYLCRLVTPPGGTVLDPFVGSGTTGCAALLEGFDFIGIERDPDYIKIAEARIDHWKE